MKVKYFSLLLIFSVFSTVISAQITRKQADSIVLEYIKKEVSNYHLLYSNESIVANENGVTTISTWHKESVSINHPCFIYFIDESPDANWEHPCRYVFVNTKNGQLSEKKATVPPQKLEEWKLLTLLPDVPKGAKFDFSKTTPQIRSGSNPQNCYAVIINGGMDCYNNWVRYWNNCSAMYSALIHKYGYLKNNIYVLMSDGTDPEIDRHHDFFGIYDSSPLDLDNDGLPDIQYAATRDNITMVFNTLSTILKPEDNLFIFTTGHGSIYPLMQETTLMLWLEEMTASEFASEVDKVRAGTINIVMSQCHSGGFIPHLEAQGRTIATACLALESSWSMTSQIYDEFIFYWISAVLGRDPYLGNTVNADSNNDGKISMKEAFDYAKARDTKQETPQYSSTAPQLGEYLTLLGGTMPCSTPNYNFTTNPVTTNTTVNNCGNINVQNVQVKNGAKLILDAGESTKIPSGFKVDVGSTLKIR